MATNNFTNNISNYKDLVKRAARLVKFPLCSADYSVELVYRIEDKKNFHLKLEFKYKDFIQSSEIVASLDDFHKDQDALISILGRKMTALFKKTQIEDICKESFSPIDEYLDGIRMECLYE